MSGGRDFKMKQKKYAFHINNKTTCFQIVLNKKNILTIRLNLGEE